MLGKLVRMLSVALLAASVVAAPVRAALPRCCHTGAIAGSDDCCCAAERQVEAVADCCVQPQKSCCASSDSQPQPPVPSTKTSCHCELSSPTPAVPPQSTRAVIRAAGLVAPLVVDQADCFRPQAALQLRTERTEPMKIPLHKVLCRWTV